MNAYVGIANAVPDYVEDLTKGRGRLGFLERDYHIVERIRDAIENQGASGVLGLSGIWFVTRWYLRRAPAGTGPGTRRRSAAAP